MSIRSKAGAIALLALLLCSGDTEADGIWNAGVSGSVWGSGVNNSSSMGSGGGGGSCSNALDFSAACNSQYIGVL